MLKKSTKKKPPKKPKASKLMLWFKHFTNEQNRITFLNKTASAKAAKYNAKTDTAFRSIGYQNFTKLHKKIAKWLNDIGLSDESLKVKLLDLINAKETKFFQKDGVVIETREVESLEVQRKSLDMALKVKGLYAAEKKELTGPGGGPIETKMTDFPTEPMTVAAWEELRNEAEKKRKAEPESSDPGSSAIP